MERAVHRVASMAIATPGASRSRRASAAARTRRTAAMSLTSRCFEASLQARVDGGVHVSGGSGPSNLGNVNVALGAVGLRVRGEQRGHAAVGRRHQRRGLQWWRRRRRGPPIAAVVAVAVLPIILYAVDGDADEATLSRYECPSLRLGLTGGAMMGAANQDAWMPMSGVRLGYYQGLFGMDASWEGTLDGGPHVRRGGPAHAAATEAEEARGVGVGGGRAAGRLRRRGAQWHRGGAAAPVRALPHRRSGGGARAWPALFVGNRGRTAASKGMWWCPWAP